MTSVALAVVLRGGREGFAPGVAPAGTNHGAQTAVAS